LVEIEPTTIGGVTALARAVRLQHGRSEFHELIDQDRGLQWTQDAFRSIERALKKIVAGQVVDDPT